MIDRELRGYRFKHKQRISLDGYTGVASKLMLLNDPIADDFMRVSDMRKDIVVVQRRPNVTYDYDQVGFVRTAKSLELTRAAKKEPDGIVTTFKDGDQWVIEIDDQKLLKKTVGDGEENKGVNEQYIDRFTGEVRNGTREILFKEKIFNSGKYSYAVLMNCLVSMSSYSMLTLGEIASILTQTHTLETDVKALVLMATGHIVGNTMSFGFVMAKRVGLISRRNPMGPDYEEPYIRHQFVEAVMPAVPFDRLIRGLAYDRMHGSDLIVKS